MSEPTKDTHEINASDYTVGSLMAAIIHEEIELPVWIRFKKSRIKIGHESAHAFCRGLLVALEMKE
jgi:hypothetical protein